jgi:hypothetical protein
LTCLVIVASVNAMNLVKALSAAIVLLSPALSQAAQPARLQCLVFEQDGFPTVESEAVAAGALRPVLSDCDLSPASLDDLLQGAHLAKADLLILPHGSAFPAAAWPLIRNYIKGGGSVLNLGGRPFSVPVQREKDGFRAGATTQAYAREIGLWHSYVAPDAYGTSVSWEDDFAGFPALSLQARRVFVLAPGAQAGHYRGLGHLTDRSGARVAAPITRIDYIGHQNGFTPTGGARCVFLPFEPEPGFWESSDGKQAVRWAAQHALRGATRLWLEVQHPTVAAGEPVQVIVHVQRSARGVERAGPTRVRVELRRDGRPIESQTVAVTGVDSRLPLLFKSRLRPGLYALHGTLEDARGFAEGHVTGVWARDRALLARGPRLSTDGETFRRDGAPYLPVGVNYFSTDPFTSGLFVGANPCGNPYRWERDFAEMERHGITFVRTGTWLNHDVYLDKVTDGAEERYLRSLEAFLLSAARHRLLVQFTFFAFDPQTIRRAEGGPSIVRGVGDNPYLDPAARQAQIRFVQSIVGAFKDVPFLSWDLINEPSFANPLRPWIGNVSNGDVVEQAAYRSWLKKRYETVERLAQAWNTSAEALGPDLAAVAPPSAEALELKRFGSTEQARLFDWNLFAQEGFSSWVRELIAAVRGAGSEQPVVVGHDEGGVANRILNQFYADAGVAFTVNHSWWRDDALLWDSLAAKRPDLPAFLGETGMQPAWRVDGTWRHDELTTAGLVERKLALGFAGGQLGSLHWDWSQEDVFGLKRSDGSRKTWLGLLGGLARFASEAAPHTGRVVRHEVAIVLPQSLQLSVMNRFALEAQQRCVRALYHEARAAAYVVGEHQLALSGEPRLIILPSPWILTDAAWQQLLASVRKGAVLAVTGPIDLDEHFRPVARLASLGLPGGTERLDTREAVLRLAERELPLSFSGDKTTHLERGVGEKVMRLRLDRGEIIWSPWPIELNDNQASVGELYREALRAAGVTPAYTTEVRDPGVLIAPTRFEDGTLYVLTSESAQEREVALRDASSGATHRAQLAPGRAALAFVLRDGRLAARYGEWN